VSTSYANTVSNIAFSLACVMFLALGAIRIEERLTGKTTTPRAPDPVETAEGQSLSIADAQTIGSSTARVVLVEFSDFQCPYCGRHDQDTFEAIKSEFVDSGKIKQVFMHLPLQSHSQARAAAEAAECAGKQGRFWEMRRHLFANQTALSAPEAIPELAGRLHIDQQVFKKCLNGQTSAKIMGHLGAAEKLGLRSTPSFVIGREREAGRLELSKKIVGAHSIDVFRAALQDVLETR
jgi:protein-disulfide isomerase